MLRASGMRPMGYLRQSWWLAPLVLLLACATGLPGVVEPQQASSRTDSSLRGAEAGELESPGDCPPVVLAGGAGTPGAPSSLSGARPLTMVRLRQLASSLGIGISGADVTRNREIGRALQLAVGRSLDIPENFDRFPTSVRSRYSSVVPDGVLLAGCFRILGGVTFNPRGAFLEVVDSDLVDFLEVKGRRGRLTLTTAHAQLLGLIDALAVLRRPSRSLLAGAGQPRPALLLVTTADTQIDKAVAWEAARRGVALFRATVLESEGWLIVGPFNQLTSFADAPPRFQLASHPERL
jgi:hypothetical protein